MTYAAIANAEGESFAIYPLRNMDGDYAASVKYYAAVGADCKVPDVAYAFVRQFLLEESQWERNRLKPEPGQMQGLIMGHYPVRIQGSVETLWKNHQQQISALKDSDKRQDILDSLRLSLEQYPFQHHTITAGFPCYG